MIQDFTIDEMLQKLIDQEELLADYYVYLKSQIPEYSNIWDHLEKEENGHARALYSLYEKFQNQTVEINSRVAGRSTIEYSLSKIKTETEEIKKRAHTKLELMELALTCEANTLDSIIFEVISSDSEIINQKLQWLQETTRNHEAILKDAISAHKKNIEG